MNYLLYVEHAAEHLQFFMWFRGYVQRFDALVASEKALSPEWTLQNQKAALEEWKKTQANIQKQQPSTAATEVLKGTIFSKDGMATAPGLGVGNPFATPPQTSHGRASQNTEDIRTPTANRANLRGGASSPWESSTMVKSPTHTSLSTNLDSQRLKETASSAAHDAFENAGLSQPCLSHFPNFPTSN